VGNGEVHIFAHRAPKFLSLVTTLDEGNVRQARGDKSGNGDGRSLIAKYCTTKRWSRSLASTQAKSRVITCRNECIQQCSTSATRRSFLLASQQLTKDEFQPPARIEPALARRR